jgi:hypothetical protein
VLTSQKTVKPKFAPARKLAQSRLTTLRIIAAEPERLRVLKEHELGVGLEYYPDVGSYVPEGQE